MVVVAIVGIILTKIKQPLLIGYLITGIIISPLFLNLVTDFQTYETYAHIGVAFLLFIVGLQLNVKLIREVGTLSVVTGIGQIIFTTIIGTAINLALGIPLVSAAIIAVAITFSSTIIIVKLLSDTGATETLYGRLSLGFLLVQDFVAVLILMVISSIGKGLGEVGVIINLIIGLLASIALFIFAKKFLSDLIDLVAKNKELLFITIIAWCFGISVLYEYFGFSIEIGALYAGVLLASTKYQHEISSRIKPLRDFFLVMFFIFLGSQLIPQGTTSLESTMQVLSPLLIPAIILSLFVLIGNPLIVLLLVTKLGYSSRTGFLSGLTVSQISEFSIILAILAMDSNLLSSEHVSLITLVAIFTITISTYLIVYGDKIYNKIKFLFQILEKKQIKDSLKGLQGKKHEIGLFGYHKLGKILLPIIKETKKSYLIIDHNPAVIKKLNEEYSAVFGDISNPEFLEEFDFKDMNLVISTIPDYSVNNILLENYLIKNPKGTILLTAKSEEEALDLYQQGATYVILPNNLGGDYVTMLLREHIRDETRFIKEKIIHFQKLKK